MKIVFECWNCKEPFVREPGPTDRWSCDVCGMMEVGTDSTRLNRILDFMDDGVAWIHEES